MAAHIPLAAGAADSLTMAVISASHTPLLLLDGELNVLAASRSFCQAFGLEQGAVAGARLSELGDGEWDMPRLGSLLNATLSWQAQVEAYEIDLVREDSTRKLELNAQKLVYADSSNARLLLAITDVTETRRNEKSKDDRLHAKAVMLQEMQHRVANSLQIIASVLIQSARNVTSEETRTHLKDAHHRVMSIGAMQQQLTPTGQGSVELSAYFTQLCASIAASMIRDPTAIVLTVQADKTWLDAEDAVSLGLIVTELTINALKHAFPEGRSGEIKVEYRLKKGAGTLTVSDNGVGMSAGLKSSKPGLGTSIVEALTKQLGGKIEISDNEPGTVVTVVNNRPPMASPIAA